MAVFIIVAISGAELAIFIILTSITLPLRKEYFENRRYQSLKEKK